MALGASVLHSIGEPVISRVCEPKTCTNLSWDDEDRSLLLDTGVGTFVGMSLSIVMVKRVRSWREQP